MNKSIVKKGQIIKDKANERIYFVYDGNYMPIATKCSEFYKLFNQYEPVVMIIASLKNVNYKSDYDKGKHIDNYRGVKNERNTKKSGK